MDVELKFTQEDRDMIRDTNRDVKEVLAKVQGHIVDLAALGARVTKLESWRTGVMAICGFLGFVAGVVLKRI